MRLRLRLARADASDEDIVVVADRATTVGVIAQVIRDRDPLGAAAGHPSGPVTLETERDSSDDTDEEGGLLAERIPPATALSDAPIRPGDRIEVVAERESIGADSVPRAELSVVAGPATGRRVALGRGTSFIGRDPACEVQLVDGSVSRRHARIEVGDEVVLVDLGSANGLVVDGTSVSRVRLTGHEIVWIGDSAITVRSTPGHESAPRSRRFVPFHRTPRVVPRFPGREFVAPEVPGALERPPFPWIVVAAPLLVAAVALLSPGPTAFRIAFAVLGPLSIAAAFLTRRVERRRADRLAAARFDAELDELDRALGQAVAHERAVRDAEAPVIDVLLDAVRRRTPLLWTRRPEHWNHLQVRLGVGRAPSRSTVTGVAASAARPELAIRLREVVAAHAVLDGLPIVERLDAAGAIGVAGPGADEVAAALVLQLAALHSPADLVVACLVDADGALAFDWLRHLPHADAAHALLGGSPLADSAASVASLLDRLEALIERRAIPPDAHRFGPAAEGESTMAAGARIGERPATGPPPGPAVLVIVGADAPVDRARLERLAEEGPFAGVHPLWLAERAEALPAACRSFVALDGGAANGLAPGTIGFVRDGRDFRAAIESLPRPIAGEIAARLGRVVDPLALPDGPGDLPSSVALGDLLGDGVVGSAEAVLGRWRENDSVLDRSGPPMPRRRVRLRGLLGRAADGPVRIDLRAEGPHALVGGTTGSGKSELLRSWVLGMAAELSPDRLAFLLVDYKGGSAFGDCVALPHCVGLVTDLDGRLVDRALVSLRAELRRRERLLAEHGHRDIVAFEGSGHPACPPSLVIVVDEFAALIAEVPAFVDGVVDLAQRGRSLGIHLVMATQRPAGVIRESLRANTNLRIALRTADPQDSADVVGSSLAAGFDPGTPGRAVAAFGGGRRTVFQAANSTLGRVGAETRVRIEPLRFGAPAPWPVVTAGSPQSGPSDAAALVASARAAASAAGIPAPRRPWLDPLPVALDLDELETPDTAGLAFGLVDVPAEQARRTATWHPETDGHLLAIGAAGSGKSTLLRTIATAALRSHPPVHVYGIDFTARGLAPLAALPEVGAIVDGADGERVDRLVRMLRAECERRAAAGSSTAHRDEPRILLLVDGVGELREAVEHTGSPAFGVLRQVMADGARLGIHLALTADRPAAVPPSLAPMLGRRVVLRAADEHDLRSLGVRPELLPMSAPPGRGLVDGLEFHAARLGGVAGSEGETRALAALAARPRGRGFVPPSAVGRLPEAIDWDRLPRIAGEAVIGVADDTLEAIGIAPDGAFLVAGPPGSGRTTALLTILRATVSVVAGAKLVHIGPERSVVRSAVEWAGFAADPEEIAALARSLLPIAAGAGAERLVLVVESAGELLANPADTALAEIIRVARRAGHFVLAEGEVGTLLPNWPGIAELRRARRGLILHPDPLEAEALLRTPVPRARGPIIPGRGVLVERGRARVLHIALPAASSPRFAGSGLPSSGDDATVAA